MVWIETVTTLLFLSYCTAQETTRESSDLNCRHPTTVKMPLAQAVLNFSPFYAVAATRNKKTEEIDNVCYTYFGDSEPFLHIISIVYRDGSDSQIVLEKFGLPNEPQIAQAEGLTDDCLYHDYTLIPVCNQTVFVIYRCFLLGACDQLDVGPTYGVDARVVLNTDPRITPPCAGDIARSLSDTSELSGKNFLYFPHLHLPKCVTTFTTPAGRTLQCIGADRARETLRSLKERY